MARARNIKPGFFKNEELVELPYETRLLFIGLWTIADREGRLEDRPKRIKMELFPADSIDIDECLNQLQASGFVLRYTIAGARYIQVLAFSKHQNPHQKEAASTIPAPDSDPEQDGEAPDEHDASPVPAPDEHDASPADSLIPSSLIPESMGEGAGAPAQPDAKAKRATRLPKDFTLTDARMNYAIEKGMDRKRAEYQFERLLNWADANDVTRKDWDAQWRNWVLKDVNENGKSASPDRPVAWRLNASGVMVEVAS